MSQLANRAPGMVGAALEDDSTWAGIIVDGHHLHPAPVRVAVRAKRADRLMLVTDAMPSVGPDAAPFELQRRTIRRQGVILPHADGVLAGSAQPRAGAGSTPTAHCPATGDAARGGTVWGTPWSN